MVENLPSNAGDVGSIPGRGTKISHAMGQLSLHATTTEPTLWSPHATTREKLTRCKEEPAHCKKRSCMQQLRPDAAKNK